MKSPVTPNKQKKQTRTTVGNETRIRLSLEWKEPDQDELDGLMADTGADSKTEAIRYAIAVTRRVHKAMRLGRGKQLTGESLDRLCASVLPK